MIPARTPLGGSHQAEPVWADGADRRTAIPSGVAVQHLGLDGNWCVFYVGWALRPDRTDEGPGDLWTLESLRPLTVSPAIRCPRCGLTGVIQSGRWHDRSLTPDEETGP